MMSDIDELGAILKHYREFADLAWSEVTDKVHTVEEYHEALEKLTKDHAKQIEDLYRNKILEARVSAKKEVLEYTLNFTKSGAIVDWDFIDGYYGTDPEITAQFNSKGDNDAENN